MDRGRRPNPASDKGGGCRAAGPAGGRTVEADAAGRCRWWPRPTIVIWGRGQVLALTSQVRPRPAHDICRDQPKALPCAEGTSEPCGAG